MCIKIVFLLLLFSASLFGQSNTLDLILPVKTYHFDRSDLAKYDFGEGGNLGAIVSLISHRKTFDNIYSTGIFKNSYGKYSLMASYGKKLDLNQKLSVGLNIGIATNYKDAYHSFDRKGNRLEEKGRFYKLFKPLYNISSIPFGGGFCTYELSSTLGTILTVNPVYANLAIFIKLKK